jgi:hypothetical protein
MLKWYFIFFSIFFMGLNACSDASVRVEKLEVIEIDFPTVPVEDYIRSYVNRAYFDERNQLQWNDNPLTPSLCTNSSHNRKLVCRRKVLLLNPRVDLCECSDVSDASKRLIGLDDKEKIIWQRDLSPSQETPVGTTPQAIVLNTLEVISPKTGTVLEPAIMKSVRGTNRLIQNRWGELIPKYRFYTPIAFRVKTKDFLLFDAEVSLFTSKGGLYLFNPKNETKELVKKVERYFFKYLEVKDIAFSQNEKLAFLAQKWETRGPDGVSFAIFDLEKKQIVFEERLENACSCDEPFVVVGKNGNVAIFYRNHNIHKHIVVHYVISP